MPTTLDAARPLTRGTPEPTGQVVPVPSPSKPIRAVLMTSAKAADGLSLDPRGCDLSRFQRNPVLLEAHDQKRLPIGRVRDIRIENNRITGVLDFSKSTRGREAHQDVLDGYTNAVSIGFDVDKSSRDWRSGRVSKWILTEVSLVPVPLDSEAVIYERGYRPSPTYQRAVFPLALDEQEPAMDYADVEPAELKRAVVDLLVRMGISVNIRGEEIGWTRGGDADYTRGEAKPSKPDDEDDYDPDAAAPVEAAEADMDESEEDEEDEDVDDDDLEEDEDDDEEDDDDNERGYEADYIRAEELPDLLAELGVQPHFRSHETVDADVAATVINAFTLDSFALTR